MYTNLRAFQSILAWVSEWTLAMGWHLWRILTLRPAHDKIGDTKMAAISFVATYWMLSLTRWVWLEGKPIGSIAFNLFGYMCLLALLFERGWRSSSLFLSALGASAAVDLAAILLTAIGLNTEILGYSVYYEVFLILVCVVMFFRQPKAVQSSGYKRMDQQ